MSSISDPMGSRKEATVDSSYDMGFGDSDFESPSMSSEEDDDINKDYWFGKKYFECVVAQWLLTQTNLHESMLKIDAKLEDIVRQYPYSIELKELQTRGLWQPKSDADDTGNAYQAMMACVGAIVRQGTRDQRTVLITTIRRHAYLHTAPAPRESGSLFPQPERHDWDESPFPTTIANEEGPMPASTLGHCASKLKEYGDQHGWVPEYVIECLSQVPPKFRAIVSCKDFTFEGTGTSKKRARHGAAQDACKFFKLVK